jgi:hypothetical protein
MIMTIRVVTPDPLGPNFGPPKYKNRAPFAAKAFLQDKQSVSVRIKLGVIMCFIMNAWWNG